MTKSRSLSQIRKPTWSALNLEWVEERLKQLKLAGFTTEEWYEDVEDYDHVSDLVMALAKALGKFAGASLIGLDLASDTYPVIILPSASAKEFRDAGNAIGYESVDWQPDGAPSVETQTNHDCAALVPPSRRNNAILTARL